MMRKIAIGLLLACGVFAGLQAQTVTNPSIRADGTTIANTNGTLSTTGQMGGLNISGLNFTTSGTALSDYFLGPSFKMSGTSAVSSTYPQVYSATPSILSFSVPGIAAGGVDISGHWREGSTATPTIAANACGSTTQGTIAANGNDQAFQVTVGTAAVTSCTITFSSAFTTAPRAVEITPANSAGAAVGTTLAYVSAISTTAITITGSALAGASYYVQAQ